MPLTDVIVRNAKPTGKTCKLSDARGLYLEVSPTGSKWWRLKYRFDGKEKRLALGVYPDVGLKDARERREAARKLLSARNLERNARLGERPFCADDALCHRRLRNNVRARDFRGCQAAKEAQR